jgi:hypothetical protein
LDPGIAAYFDELIALARAHLTDVEVARRDATSQRAILELRGTWERYTIRLVEIVTPDGREYRYYVFDGTYIVAGFNNHADLSAIRLRHGDDWKQHRYEPVSHLHLDNKTKGDVIVRGNEVLVGEHRLVFQLAELGGRQSAYPNNRSSAS